MIAEANFIQLLLESEFTIFNDDKNNTWRQFVCINIFLVVVFDDIVLFKIQYPCNIVDNKTVLQIRTQSSPMLQ